MSYFPCLVSARVRCIIDTREIFTDFMLGELEEGMDKGYVAGMLITTESS